jgi:hypothetical protein
VSSQDKNLPYEILTLSHFGFKYSSVQWRQQKRARVVAAAAAVTAPWHYHPDRIATYVCYLMLANYWLLLC